MNFDLTAEEVRRIFDYDKETGRLVWAHPTLHKSRTGREAGCFTPEGYRMVKVRNLPYAAHRIAWLYVYGVWPTNEIDHINRNPADNRIANLRDVTTSENQHNQAFTNRKGKSGLLGAHRNEKAKCWQSTIIVNKRPIYLGLFKTPELAHAAYLEAKAKYHPSNPTMLANREGK